MSIQQNHVPAPAAEKDDGARLVIGRDGRIIHITPDCAAAIGASVEAARGQAFSDIMQFTDPDEALRPAGLFRSVTVNQAADSLREGVHEIVVPGAAKPVMIQFDRITAPDGRVFVIGAVVKNRKGSTARPDDAFAARMLQIIDSLTASAQAPARAKISGATDEGELRHFLNMSNDVMAICLRDGTFSRVNSTFNQIMEFPDTELRQMTFMDLVHAEDKPHVRNGVYGMMHDETGDGQIIDFEARVITGGGALRWMEWRMKRSASTIYIVGRDVTATKSHEEALIRHQQQLDEAQAIGHMGHWQWTVGTDVIDFSDEIYRIFGVARGAFVPTLDKINAMLHRRDVGRLMQAFQRAIIEKNNYDMEFRVIRPDGETRYVRCEGRCETDDDGDVTALFGIMQDITERTLHERDLRSAKDAAERAYAAKSQFLANMSHELRTPLNAIIGFSEMMQRQLLGPIGTERYIDYITGIRESGEHLLDLISDILDMSKIEAGKYELDLEELNVAKVIKLALHMMEGRAQESQIRITSEISNDDRVIIADRRAVMQILLNLLSNAVKFSDRGSAVKVECADRDGFIVMKVTDNGIGIPANKLKDITRPFEQAASHYTREHEGTGLGLAITKDLIELHGGSLHIESTVGVGTVVTVRLPFDAYAHVKKAKTAE
jgi:two-component system cell cycle sensor histidine kinase PleC